MAHSALGVAAHTMNSVTVGSGSTDDEPLEIGLECRINPSALIAAR